MKSLSGKRILVTAGPTHEPIDPVRFIGNHSSGKMGLAIADALAGLGAEVILVKGPVPLQPESQSIRVHPVNTAAEMFSACQQYFSTCDVIVFAAAVADYTPKVTADKKIKKDEGTLLLELVKTTDIAATLGKEKQTGQFIVGFALETDDEMQNALSKLERKNFDLIILNSMKDEGAGFGHDTNRITAIDRKGQVRTYPLKSKKEVANDIVSLILEGLSEKEI